MNPIRFSAIALALVIAGSAAAQDKGTLNPKPLAPLANPDDPKTPAKDLFGRKLTPANLQARAIGFYTRGCLAGGIALPVNGKNWQVMRLSRNRNWGHPDLIALLERRIRCTPPNPGWAGLTTPLVLDPGDRITGRESSRPSAVDPLPVSGRATGPAVRP